MARRCLFSMVQSAIDAVLNSMLADHFHLMRYRYVKYANNNNNNKAFECSGGTPWRQGFQWWLSSLYSFTERHLLYEMLYSHRSDYLYSDLLARCLIKCPSEQTNCSVLSERCKLEVEENHVRPLGSMVKSI